MAVKWFGERTGAILIKDMYIGNQCEKDERRWAEESAGRYFFETNA